MLKLVSRMGSNLFDTGGSTPSYFPPFWSGSENLYFPCFSSLLIGRPYAPFCPNAPLCSYAPLCIFLCVPAVCFR